MNGYKMLAENNSAMLERIDSDEEREKIKSKIKVYELLAQFDKEDKYTAFDSSMFNDIFKGYVEILTENLPEEYKQQVRDKSHVILEEVSAKEAEAKYCK